MNNENEQPNYCFSWADHTQDGLGCKKSDLPRNGDPEYPPDVEDSSPYTAEDALRSISFQLASGGYNSDKFSPEDFEKRIMAGIDGLTAPLMDQLSQKAKRIDALEESHERLVKALDAAMALDEPQRQLEYLHQGIGTATRNKAWLECEQALEEAKTLTGSKV